MAVCQFFLKGQCRFGDQCRNEHPQHLAAKGPGTFGNQTWTAERSPANTKLAFSADTIKKDLTPGEDRPLWPLSSYGPAKTEPTLIQGLDESPEELRFMAWQALKSGDSTQIEAYKTYEHNKIAAASSALKNGQDHTEAAFQAAYRAHAGPPSSQGASAFGQPSTLGQAPQPAVSTFGQPVSAFGQPPKPASAFGQSAFGQTPQPTSAFGQSAFGKTAQPTSAFGQPPQTTSAFGQAAKPTSAFGQSAFGQPAFGQSSQPASVFGQTTFGQTAKPASAFGQSTFGQPSQPTSAFGQPTQPTSAFGQTSAFGPAAPGSAFGQPSQPASAFGQPSKPASAPGQPAPATPAAFGGSGFGNATGGPGAFGSSAGGGSRGGGFSAFANAAGTPNAFGQPAGAGMNTPAPGGRAGDPRTAPQSAFGAGATSSAFGGGGPAPAPASAFGAGGTGSAFGGGGAGSAFGSGPAPAFGGGPASNSTSVFSSQPSQPQESAGPSNDTKPVPPPLNFAPTSSSFVASADPYIGKLPPNYMEMLPKAVREAFESKEFQWGSVPEWIPPVETR